MGELHLDLVTKDNKGNFYVSVLAGDTVFFFKYESQNNHLTEFFSFIHKGKQTGGRILFTDSRNNHWLGTAPNGNLFHFDSTGKLINSYLNSHLLVENIGGINEIFENKDGTIWIAAAKGLYQYDYNSKRINKIKLYSSDGPNNILTNTFFSDRSGLLWIGSYAGLFKLNYSQEKFRHLTADKENPVLLDNFILGIHPSSQNKVWIIYQWGIRQFSLLDLSEHSVKHFPLNGPTEADLFKEAFLQNQQYIDEKIFQKYAHTNLPFQGSLPLFLLFDRQRNLWISSSNWIRIFLQKESLITSATILDVKIIGDEIWVATDGEGLQSLNTITRSVSKYTFKPNANSISDNNLTCLLPDEKGNLWIGTRGGLNYFDRSKNKFFHYSTSNGLSHNSVFSLVKDNKERLWIGTANGLSCMNTEMNSFKKFFRPDGLINSEFNRYSACKLDNGYILMGGMDGIDYFYPDSLLTINITPQVQITDFKIFNKTIPDFSDLSLKHNENYVTIDFAVMNFRNVAANQFAYKLEGIDKDWVLTGKEHSISYATLAPGRYHFLVKAAGPDGTWNETPAEIYFTIAIPWWKSWWFLS
ncbi:MAG TPA: two-component regulator propeller domain-containing protein, partial [Chitinophagaceae bacterium]|nr:two-component regulator propeller domain-containing protein [Chitinophagaceae bacterium]